MRTPVVLATLATVVLSFFAPFVAMAQPAPRVKATKVAEPSPYTVTAHAGAGLGVFQDIQVPMNDEANRRADGTASGTENADHAGIPLIVGIGGSYKSGSLTYNFISFDAVQMRATTGPAESQSASYSRVQLSSGATYERPLGDDWSGSIGLRVGARRSSFNNVSSSHYVEAALVGASLGLKTSTLELSAFGNVAAKARFGYSQDVILGGEAFAHSTATLAEFGIGAAFAIAPRVFLDTGLEQERCSVTMTNLVDYNKFGLSAEDNVHPTRAYNLATSIARIGIRKEF